MEKKKLGTRIPVKAAADIGKLYGYNQVVIHAFSLGANVQTVATWGQSQADCENAAAGGNAIKKLLGWPEDQCKEKPARQIKREEFEKMQSLVKEYRNVIDAMVQVIDNPVSDIVAFGRLVGFAVVAKKIIEKDQ